MRQCLAHLITMTLSVRRAQISLLLSTQHVFNNQSVKDGLLLSDLFGIGYLMFDSVLIPQRYINFMLSSLSIMVLINYRLL